MEKEWICTDPSTSQYMRQLSEWSFEFKEDEKIDDFLTETHQGIVDLSNWQIWDIEDIINTYGYSLKPGKNCVFTIYPESAWQIVAECLFEITGGDEDTNF